MGLPELEAPVNQAHYWLDLCRQMIGSEHHRNGCDVATTTTTMATFTIYVVGPCSSLNPVVSRWA